MVDVSTSEAEPESNVIHFEAGRRSLDRSSENCILRPSKRRAPAVKVQRAHGDGPVINFSKEEKWPIGGQRRKKPTPAVPPKERREMERDDGTEWLAAEAF